MSKPEYQNRPIGAAPVEPGPTAGEQGLHDKLQAVFGEATALANQLRKTAALAHGHQDSPGGGWGILEILGHLGSQTVPGIARLRAVSRQNIQTLVNRLESRGYVALTANPAHKRSGLVHLTERGKRLLTAVMERDAKLREGLLPYVPETRLLPAARLLRQLRQLLAGHELPPDELAGRRPVRKRTRARPRPSRRRAGAPVSADLPLPPEPGEPDENEFPINLL